ncbi:MAG: hypothetical protein KKD18_04155 [Nanoarchaeota archaeon]|nr:hypothetical protein [Nanoarchaeota archaeon]
MEIPDIRVSSDREEMQKKAEEFKEELQTQTPEEKKEEGKKVVKNLLKKTKEKSKPRPRLYGNLEKTNRDDIKELTRKVMKGDN